MQSDTTRTAFVPKVLTANSLRDGHVVFLDAATNWTPNLCDAVVARDEAALQVLSAALEACAGQVVEPYLVAVLRQADDNWQPVKMRERCRVQGPSVGPEASTQYSRGRAA